MILSLLQSLQQIACLTPLVWGVWLSFQVLRFPDLTFQGTFTLGAAVFAVVSGRGETSLLVICAALLASFLSGSLGGSLTALANSKLGVPSLLSGISVSLMLYSISLLVMSGPTQQVEGLAFFPTAEPSGGDQILMAIRGRAAEFILLLVLIIPFFILLRIGLVSRLGLFVRASGSNPLACDGNGIESGRWLALGLAVANGYAGFSGALFAYNLRFSDVSFGSGILALALGTIIMAEAFNDGKGWSARLLALCAALSVFQAIRVTVLRSPIGSDYLRFVEGFFLLVLIALSAVVRHRRPLQDLRL